MKLIDVHNHSSYSFDGDCSIEKMCEAAKKYELYAFAITDHADVNSKIDGFNGNNISMSIRDTNNLKGKFGDLKILSGFELGQALQNQSKTNELLSLNDVDFVIGSLHNADNEEDFYFMDFEKLSIEEVARNIDKYYKEIYEMVKVCDFDVLGHITYPFRYIYEAKSKNVNINIPIELYDEMIFEILKKTIEVSKGIEINTSGLRQKIGETMPGMKYAKMYHQLGGEIISIGSDSHNIATVGHGIKDAYVALKNIGFKYVTYFENRKPVMIQI